MTSPFDDGGYRMRAARQWNRYLDEIDREIAEEREAAPQTEAPPLSPFVVDQGQFTTRADNAAIQRWEDRITAMDRRDRGR